jgi:hypothetical protein
MSSSSSPPIGAGHPPQFILVQHSPSSPSAGSASATALSHPKIEYLYADDSPAVVLPRFPGEHVIVLDCDPSTSTPRAQSISPAIAVSNVKVTDAPGTTPADELEGGDGKMYVIETMGIVEDDKHLADESDSENVNAQVLLSRYKQRCVCSIYTSNSRPDDRIGTTFCGMHLARQTRKRAV